MSGEVNTVSIAQLQARIADLKGQNTPEARAEIQKLTTQIGDMLKNAGKVETSGGELNISEEMGFKQNNKIADKETTEAMAEFSRDGAGSKKEARAAVNEEFGAGFDEKVYDATKADLKAARKKLKSLEKDAGKIKFKDYRDNPAGYNAAIAKSQATIADQTRIVQQLEKEMVDLEALKRGDSKKFAKKFEKAAHKNVEQYEETQELTHVFVDKKQAKEFKEANPELAKGVKVASDDDMEALTKLQSLGTQAIKEAEESGDEAAIKAAHAKYDDYVNIFGQNEDGSVDYTNINVRNVQNVLVDMSGGDQRFNIDETRVFADKLNMKNSDIEDLADTFNFGHESRYNAKWRAAGIAAGAALVGNAINAAFGNTHSHQHAESTSVAEGQTVQGKVEWIASNGEEFRHIYKAQGGQAVASAVADACAKIPVVGQLAGPALAGVTAFILTKGQPEDLFNGANAEAVLENIQTADKDARPVLKQIRDMEITGDPKRDAAIKLAVIKASMGEDTKACNLRELSKAYIDLKNTKEKIRVIEEEVQVEQAEEVKPPEPPKPDPVDYDVKQDPPKEVRTELPRMKYREGTWYTSHAYVADDGSNLSAAERKLVQAELKKAENKIALVDTNNDGKADFRDKKVSLPTEIELPNGKKVKVAPDAYERIMKLPASGGGKNTSYGVHVKFIDGKWFVVDPKQNNKKIAGPYNTEAQARTEERRLEDEANKPKETK